MIADYLFFVIIYFILISVQRHPLSPLILFTPPSYFLHPPGLCLMATRIVSNEKKLIKGQLQKAYHHWEKKKISDKLLKIWKNVIINFDDKKKIF